MDVNGFDLIPKDLIAKGVTAWNGMGREWDNWEGHSMGLVQVQACRRT